MENIEISFCARCGHDYQSDCTDLGTYRCPKCNKYKLPDGWRERVQNVVKQMEAKRETTRKVARN